MLNTRLLAILYMVMPAGIPPGPNPPGVGVFAFLGSCFSTMMACVVSRMPAMPHALERPCRVTLEGSKMPASSRFSILFSIWKAATANQCC